MPVQVEQMSTFVVCSSPSKDLSLTNYVYVNPDNYATAYMSINHMVWSVNSSHLVPPFHLALNAIQRRQLKISVGDVIQIENLNIDFFAAKNLVFKLDPVKCPDANIRMNYNSLQALFEDEYTGFVFSKGQKIVFNYGSSHIIAECVSDVDTQEVTGDTNFEFVLCDGAEIDLI